MSRIDECFDHLKSQGKKAFLPFVTAGDPNLALTAKLLRTLDQSGAAMAEVGIPYSDPIADGPVIQASYTRALDAGAKLGDILQMVASVSPELKMPLVSMVSYSIILRHGMQRYVTAAKEAGFSGAIVPDLLVEESAELGAVCRSADFSLIHLVTPTTPRERMLQIAEATTGFIYFVSVTGITGERNELPPQLVDQVGWLRRQTSLPIYIGFGISKPEHVRQLAPVADGLIVGSAIVRRFAEHQDEAEALASVAELANELMSAMEDA